MRPSEALELHRAEIRQIVERNGGANPHIFGSVLSHEDTEESDLDLLINPLKETSLFDLSRMEYLLEDLLGVSVEIVTPRALPVRFRADVLTQAVPV